MSRRPGRLPRRLLVLGLPVFLLAGCGLDTAGTYEDPGYDDVPLYDGPAYEPSFEDPDYYQDPVPYDAPYGDPYYDDFGEDEDLYYDDLGYEEPDSYDDPGYGADPGHGADLDCEDIGEEVLIDGYDPNGLDADGDGTGCEGW